MLLSAVCYDKEGTQTNAHSLYMHSISIKVEKTLIFFDKAERSGFYCVSGFWELNLSFSKWRNLMGGLSYYSEHSRYRPH